MDRCRPVDAHRLGGLLELRALARRRATSKGRVLFVGHAYYNSWYLSRELRRLGWKADVVDCDANLHSRIYYHGEDFRLNYTGRRTDALRHLGFYLGAAANYDIFHFSNAHSIRFGQALEAEVARHFEKGDEIRLLKRLGKKIAYTNNGCLDGVAQSTFAKWGSRPVCADCAWRDMPEVCSDERNLAWGAFRNEVADFQVLAGGNRADYNVDPHVHEVPEFYCLDDDVWRPDLEIPERFRLPHSDDTVKIYHAVGNLMERSEPGTLRNVKSTHIYLPLIEELKAEGRDIELIHFHGVPNRDLRFYQAQADIFVDMLTYGFFGATAREAMMLGKPVVCYLRPEWMESMRAEVPGYVEELPIVSATPETVRDVLTDLIEDPEKRRDLGRAGREFSLKWHSSKAAARRFDRIYSQLLDGDVTGPIR